MSATAEIELETREYAKLPKYDYLLSMSCSSMTTDRVETLHEEELQCQKDLEYIKSLTPTNMWSHDLDVFEKALDEYDIRKREAQICIEPDLKPQEKKTRKKTK